MLIYNMHACVYICATIPINNSDRTWLGVTRKLKSWNNIVIPQCMYVCIMLLALRESSRQANQCMYVHVQGHTGMTNTYYIYIYTYACMYIRMTYIRMYVCMYTYTCVCTLSSYMHFSGIIRLFG